MITCLENGSPTIVREQLAELGGPPVPAAPAVAVSPQPPPSAPVPPPAVAPLPVPVLDPFAGTSTEELQRLVVFAMFDDDEPRTLRQLLDADTKSIRATRVESSDPVTFRPQQQYGITAEQYQEVQRGMEDEQIAGNATMIPAVSANS